MIRVEEPTKLRISLPASIDVTSKLALPEALGSFRDTVDNNKETPDVLPLLLETEDGSEAWPDMPQVVSVSELPTPPILSKPEESLSQAKTVPMPQIVLKLTERKQESIPTSMISRPPREQSPTQAIASRQGPPKKSSPFLWVGALAAVVFAVLLLFVGESPQVEKPAAITRKAAVQEASASSVALSPEAPSKKTKKVVLSVSSSPKGALVTLNGENLGVTPLVLALEPSQESLRLELSMEGFISVEKQISLGVDVSVNELLEKREASLKVEEAPRAGVPVKKSNTPKKTPGKNDVPNPFK